MRVNYLNIWDGKGGEEGGRAGGRGGFVLWGKEIGCLHLNPLLTMSALTCLLPQRVDINVT